MSKTETVHFTVCFEGITRLIRDIWSEGNYDKAINIIDGCNVPKEYHNDLIQGKLKMVDANPIENPGVEGTLVEDDWIPDLSLCQYGMYPTMDEMPKLAQRAMELRKVYVESDREKAREFMKRIANEVYSFEKSKLARTAREELPDCILEEFGLDFVIDVILSPSFSMGNSDSIKALGILSPYKYDDFYYHKGEMYKTGDTPDADELYEKSYRSDVPDTDNFANPDVDKFIKRQLELDKIEVVEVDKNFDGKYGVIDRNGNYFSCGWMEHDWLCDRLGTTKDDAIKNGWVVISKDTMGNDIYFWRMKKTATQKQLNTLFDYCQKWDIEMPEWYKEV